jgi:hypothetical protein
VSGSPLLDREYREMTIEELDKTERSRHGSRA